MEGKMKDLLLTFHPFSKRQKYVLTIRSLDAFSIHDDGQRNVAIGKLNKFHPMPGSYGKGVRKHHPELLWHLFGRF